MFQVCCVCLLICVCCAAALLMALRQREPMPPLLLVAVGADVTAVDAFGSNLFHCAVAGNNVRAAEVR